MQKGIVGVVVVLALLGGAYFAMPLFSGPSIEDVLSAADEQMEQAESLSFDATLEVTGKTGIPVPSAQGLLPPGLGGAAEQAAADEITEGKATIAFSGSMTNLQKEEQTGWVDFSVDVESNQGDAGIGFSVRMVDEEHRYVQLSKLELPAELSTPELDLIVDQLIEEWIQIEDTDGLVDEEEEEGEEDEDKFDDDVLGELFAVTLEEGTEEVRGKKAYKLSATPQIDAIRAYALQEYRDEHDDEEMPEDEVEELEAALTAAKDLTGAMWIGVDEAYVYKIEVAGPFTYENDSEGEMNFSIELFDYNEPVMPEIPAEVLTMEELMQRVFAVLLSNPAMLEGFGAAPPSAVY